MQGHRVGIYSGEMSVSQVQKRLSMLAKTSPSMSDKEALEELKKKDLKMTIMTQRELGGRATCKDLEKMIITDELEFLFVDQLSLMDDVNKKVWDTRTRFANISSDLFSLSCKYHLPIILAVQSNRDGSMQKDAPMLENIAESDAVGQNATRVIGIRREGSFLTMNCSKNRYGDDTFVQRYDTDYSINKFIPIIAQQPTLPNAQQNQQFRKRNIGGGF